MTVSVLEGDCLDVLRALPDARFQTCVTSPPYFGLRDYGVAGQIGLEDTPDAFVDRLVAVFREVRRVLRDDGTLWLNLGDSYSANAGVMRGRGVESDGYERPGRAHRARACFRGGDVKPKDLLGIPWMVAFALRADGWWLRSAVVWNKPNPMPESVKDRPTSAYEMVFLLSKSPSYFYDGDAIREPISDATATSAAAALRKTREDREYQHDSASRMGKRSANRVWSDPAALSRMMGGRNARNVWTITTKPYKGAHFATMPPDLAERCIKAGTSEAGACPHCGAPWERERERLSVEASGAAIGGDPARQDAGMRQRDPSGRGGNVLAARWASTGSFAPICDCPAPKPIPCAVLDPFGGAGTTGLVANRLGRAATLIELNPAYAALARQRIHGEAPLFAGAAE